MKRRLYIGVDPSLTGTALVALDEQARVQTAATIQPKHRGVERLAELRDAVGQILRKVADAGEIARVALEGYSLGNRNQAGVRSMAEWGGVLRLALYEAGLPWIEIPPATAKKYATGRGDAPKDRIALAAFKRWGIELQDEHQTDAYVLARIARDMDCAPSDDLTEFQRAILRRLCGTKGVGERGA